MNRRLMLVLLAALELAGIALAYYFAGWAGILLAVLASIAAYIVRMYIVHHRSRPIVPASAPNLWRSVDLLSFRSEINLVLGAVYDLVLAYIVVLLMGVITQIYMPQFAQFTLTLLLGVTKYLWSTNLGHNHIATYQMGSVTFLERLIPSGPNGAGLRPGYYWFPLGWPFYKLAILQDVKELTVPFENMQVWTKNSKISGQGAIDGRTDGNAQFEIIDPSQYNAITNPLVVLESIVLESARDVCESRSIEEFIDSRNDTLAAEISTGITAKLTARSSPLGVLLKSVNVTRTDNKSEAVKTGWEQINVQQSIVVARATDAAGRIRRIRGYKGAGVDANRAAALDAVVSDKAGATIGDQRFNVDVGDSLKGVAQALVSKIGG
jgi:hypothetical protein